MGAILMSLIPDLRALRAAGAIAAAALATACATPAQKSATTDA